MATTPPSRQPPAQSRTSSGTQTPLAGAGATGSSSIGPGRSAIAAAFEGSLGRSPPRYGTPPVRPLSPLGQAGTVLSSKAESFDGRQPAERAEEESTSRPVGDPEVVKRYLVRPSHENLHRPSFSPPGGPSRDRGRRGDEAPDLDEFSSLQLQGGDVTREVYRWAEDADAQSMSGPSRARRSRSFVVPRPEPEDETQDVRTIKAPGGLRRDYLRRSAVSPSPARPSPGLGGDPEQNGGNLPSQFFTSNFIEFLTLYGHFAGEELEEDDTDDYEADDYFAEETDRGEPGEGSALLTPRTPGGRRRPKKAPARGKQTTPFSASLLLLKSFVGTGVMFLPRAFLNGGMVFSSLVLIGLAGVSYHCMLLLVKAKVKVGGSYGDIGGTLYGKAMRNLILASIVLSQLGFVAAYFVFVSENLQAFTMAVSQCRTWIDIKWMVLMQLIIFLPLSLIRDISKLGGTALVADVFIVLGLVYIFYFDTATLIANGGPADIKPFNPSSWTLYLGTAIFTFEGIGLILPIQESMRNPARFPAVLAVVMGIMSVIFVAVGALSYAAFGSATHTVVLLNMPQDNHFVNAVQFLYSLAILLSTPLQFFPAIRILENALFVRSGKFNPSIKWKKNVFRFVAVMLCALVAWGGAKDLDKFVSLVGSFACIPLVYIYPVSCP